MLPRLPIARIILKFNMTINTRGIPFSYFFFKPFRNIPFICHFIIQYYGSGRTARNLIVIASYQSRFYQTFHLALWLCHWSLRFCMSLKVSMHCQKPSYLYAASWRFWASFSNGTCSNTSLSPR